LFSLGLQQTHSLSLGRPQPAANFEIIALFVQLAVAAALSAGQAAAGARDQLAVAAALSAGQAAAGARDALGQLTSLFADPHFSDEELALPAYAGRERWLATPQINAFPGVAPLPERCRAPLLPANETRQHAPNGAPTGACFQLDLRRPDETQPVLPTLFIPGFPKAATTWLFDCMHAAFVPEMVCPPQLFDFDPRLWSKEGCKQRCVIGLQLCLFKSAFIFTRTSCTIPTCDVRLWSSNRRIAPLTHTYRPSVNVNTAMQAW